MSTGELEHTSTNLKDGLNWYVLAAAAAGVSVLALAEPAHSEVVITRKTIPLAGELIYLDINNDGTNDFEFYNYFSFGSADLALRGAPGRGGAAVIGASGRYASPLMRGANVGSSANFATSSTLVGMEKGVHVGYPNEKLYGPWGGNAKNRYLGIRFRIDGKLHYGWVRITVFTQPAGAWGATITGYAYETTPNKKITVGSAGNETSDSQALNAPQATNGPSLGMLAQGAKALALWRSQETSDSK